MKIKTLQASVFVIAFLCSFVSYAQDSDVITGINAYKKENYAAALSALNKALAKPSQLKSKNLATAYYYRSKSLLAAEDKAILAKDMDWLKANPKAILSAYSACEAAKKADTKGKLTVEIDQQFQTLRQKLIQYGLINLNLLQQTKEATQKEKIYAEVMSYLQPALAIEEEYLVYDLMTQAEGGKKFASQQSHVYASKAIQLYEQAKPQSPDPYVGYLFYRKALVERYTNENLEAAWGTITKGLALLESEQQRIQRTISNEALKASLLKKLKTTRKDLSRFELDILMNTPKLHAQAIEKFETAVKKEPNNYTIHVAYARLLEDSNTAKAIQLYEQAIQIDPKKEGAYFNLGAIYNNQAAALYKKANAETDYTKVGEIQKQVDQAFEKAYVQFQKAYEVNPKTLETVNALLQISIRLEKLDDYQKYKAAKKALQGG